MGRQWAHFGRFKRHVLSCKDRLLRAIFKPLRQGLFSASVSPEMVSWPLVRMSRHGAPQVNFLGSPFFDTVGLAEEGPAMEKLTYGKFGFQGCPKNALEARFWPKPYLGWKLPDRAIWES